MSYFELVQMYFERSNALQWYWTLYVVIIGGLLAFASMRKQPDMVTTLLVTVLFCLFAYKNLGAIEDVTRQRLAVHEAIKVLSAAGVAAGPSKLLDPTLNPPTFESVQKFHWLSDVLTVLALWAMELRRRRGAKTGSGV